MKLYHGRNITNRRYHRLLVIEKTQEKCMDGSFYWKCLCDCENYTRATSSVLRGNKKKSCGCLLTEGKGGEEAGKARAHTKRLKHTYGITVEYYDNMFKEHQDRCAICHKHKTELKEKLCVDHNKDTGQVRGLLCKKCNFGIGLFDHLKEHLKSAIGYLEKYDEGN